VRIFLGSEPAQRRAERVFVWSIERVRDPGRRYEIFVMKSLSGFDARGWTTGFTNYRFAIPHFAGGRGRALYNDVDQVYLADPGLLFDTDAEGRGYRSLTPDDTSVMWIDCERMAPVWTITAARSQSKQRMHARARTVRGLWGELDPTWNVRDDERDASDTRLIHFTTLHTQPWRPFPERFAYQPNPVGHVWHALETEADAAGMQVRTREHPSDRYAAWWREWAMHAEADASPEVFLPPPPGAPRRLPVRKLHAEAWLADAPEDDLPWLLAELFAAARERVVVTQPRIGTLRELLEWEARLTAASSGHPHLAWELRSGRGRRRGGAWPGPAPPRVWVLCDERPGNATQALGLAEALAWPAEVKHLRCRATARLHDRWLGASVIGIDRDDSSPLEPPWPDLVIAAGRRTAPVAQWIRERAGGVTKIVMLGRKGGDDADLFDLVVTPTYTRLFPHPRRIETAAPLHRVSEEALAKASEEWADRLGGAPTPRIAVLVGGTSGQYRLDADTARRFGVACADLARRTGGSLLATTSRRLGAAAADAFCEAAGEIAFLHRWKPRDPENPYLGLLAHADAFVITGDSESMLAEATSLGKPVAIFALPVRPSFRLLSASREWVWRRATAKPLGPRGTPRPQRGLERWCGKAIERGFARPSRDLDRLHEALFERDLAQPFEGFDPSRVSARANRERDERADVAAAVRALLGVT
jgi:mitochondrial fission protein ELM1